MIFVPPFAVLPSTALTVIRGNKRGNTGLQEGVTDLSFEALAEAGCGKNLVSLFLRGEFPALCFCAAAWQDTEQKRKPRLARRRDGRLLPSAGRGRVWKEADIPPS